MKINCLPLFSSNVFYTYIEEDTSEINYNNFEYMPIQGDLVPDSNFAYASRNRRVLEEYPSTKKILLDKFIDIAKNVLNYNCDFQIATSWITKVKPGGFSHRHLHRNSFYSGVYYFENEYSLNSGSIKFTSPVNNLSDYDIVSSNRGNDSVLSSKNWRIPPEKKKLLLFPSYLEHTVLKNNEEVDRHSIAFNIVPMGKYGNGDSAYDSRWLN
tara:strand:+ start:715 stop:1350 length:636 start_codon:yes stop_codon:yes gene_type:complete